MCGIFCDNNTSLTLYLYCGLNRNQEINILKKTIPKFIINYLHFKNFTL